MSNYSVLQQNTLCGLTAPGAQHVYLRLSERMPEERAFHHACVWQDRIHPAIDIARRVDPRATEFDFDGLAIFIAERLVNYVCPPKGNRKVVL